jgi:hypothetical protein
VTVRLANRSGRAAASFRTIDPPEECPMMCAGATCEP